MLCPILSLLLWAGPPVEPETVNVVATPPPKPALVEPNPAEPTPAEPLSDPSPPASVSPPDLHVHWEVDAPLLLGSGAIWLGTQLALDRLVPATPRWTQASAGDLALREAAIWRSPAVARHLSDAFAYGVVPVFSLTMTLIDVGSARQWRVLHEDLIIALESVALASMLTQVIKLSAARGRPYTYEVFQDDHALPLDQALIYEPDAYLSFPSGHANFSFAFVSSFATVATMRERKLAPYLWAFGMPLAGVTAYLRVAGHRHWFSDVIVGSTIGTIVGAGLPVLLHHPRFGLLAHLSARKQRVQLTLLPSPTGATLLGQF
jgi:membrane-associated phospholipid phosphatase